MIRTKIILFVTLSSMTFGHGFRIEPRIINGTPSNPNDFPFFVNVRQFDGTCEASCGGVLLNDRWVVTGAHCVDEQGKYTVATEIGAAGRFKHELSISRRVVHPLYKPASEYRGPAYDIGLVELARPIKFSKRIQPVKLPSVCNANLTNERFLAIGNGLVNHDESSVVYPLILKQGDFKALRRNVCARIANYVDDPDSIICIKSLSNDAAVSMGDSGGPLINTNDGTLAGIISYFIHAGDEDTKDLEVLSQVCSSIHYHLGWISGVTGIALASC